MKRAQTTCRSGQTAPFGRTVQTMYHLPARFGFIIRAVPCGNLSSGMCGQRRPRSDCASAQSAQGLHCPLTESLDTTKCMNGEQRPGWYFGHAQDYLIMRILRMFEGTFFS